MRRKKRGGVSVNSWEELVLTFFDKSYLPRITGRYFVNTYTVFTWRGISAYVYIWFLITLHFLSPPLTFDELNFAFWIKVSHLLFPWMSIPLWEWMWKWLFETCIKSILMAILRPFSCLTKSFLGRSTLTTVHSFYRDCGSSHTDSNCVGWSLQGSPSTMLRGIYYSYYTNPIQSILIKIVKNVKKVIIILV